MNLGNEYMSLKKLVDDNIVSFIPEIGDEAGVLYDSIVYSLTAGGKRLRSVLMLSFYKMAEEKADMDFAMPFAAAIEFMQTCSLIHDDLPSMDNDDYRRGRLTNHKVFGDAIALLAGDALLSATFEVMLKDTDECKDPLLKARKVKAALEIAKGTGTSGMIQGQVADVINESKSCDFKTLRFIDENKTGAFIKSAVMAGCYLGNAKDELCKAASVYGECIGEAFQIVDDILDITGSLEELGKNTGVDAQLGKSTYPAILGLEESKKRAEELLQSAESAIAPFDEYGTALDIINFLKSEIQ